MLVIKKKLLSLFLPFLLISNFSCNSQIQNIVEKPVLTQIETDKNLNNISQEEESIEEKTSYTTTAHRIIFNTFFETLWNYYKTLSNTRKTIFTCNGKEYSFELTNFYKIISNLMVDEAIGNKRPNLKQKLAEFFIPTIISSLIIDGIREAESFKNNSLEENGILTLKILQKLVVKLAIKFVMVRCYFPRKTILFKVTDIGALSVSFFDPGTKRFCWKYGTTKLIQDMINRGINIANLGSKLNLRHRKKAIRKTIQALIEPFVYFALDNLENKIVSLHR